MAIHRDIKQCHNIGETHTPIGKFTRDVAVNVVANLVAAAILYLLGVYTHLLPHSILLIRTSIIVLVQSIFFIFYVLYWIKEIKRDPKTSLFTRKHIIALIMEVSSSPIIVYSIYHWIN